jgi:adenylosuccinate lyase
MAVELRHLQRTEVREVQEGFKPGQKGSSAMPHKQNAITAERLCGLTRLVRSMVSPMLEDVALWHERDIAHSSVERVVLADACALTHFGLVECTKLVHTWTVDYVRIEANLSAAGDRVLSQHVLQRLIESGQSREDAYRRVQRAVTEAVASGRSLRDVLDGEAIPWPAELADLRFPLRHANRGIDQLDHCWAAAHLSQ